MHFIFGLSTAHARNGALLIECEKKSFSECERKIERDRVDLGGESV